MANTAPLKFDTLFTIRVDQKFLDELEELRALQRPIPTKSDIIRELVSDALKRAKAKGKR